MFKIHHGDTEARRICLRQGSGEHGESNVARISPMRVPVAKMRATLLWSSSTRKRRQASLFAPSCLRLAFRIGSTSCIP
jgi:hypothetical protein